MEVFPVIHTNFWDGVLAVPIVLILTQLIKLFTPVPRAFIPTTALLIGLLLSILYSHRHHLIAGIFMGFFYGYAAIGSYAASRNSWCAFKAKLRKKEHFR
ncbi:hypothetical protein M1K46_20765 [Fictibacillus sp. WQ 8-8]|uniref:Holin n=1 Tax=Fictibacillus marinisediminis TaxID=2878389 RepID=A0A9X2BE43_9BACL|nr:MULTISPECIES: hypothetical protein [Fictibacillus]MCK6258266.1 hypothetical protein [Fictibacillus marinisediminis]MCQ6268057.1 hypothetical protein [Fictibacillus sp. WQ 8-8]UZJ80103.1 hypothetical protein OKX00_06445 [Fictibacillus sp. KU28468]SFD52122.1 hypothetical protein SAMN05428981_101750 [Bacillus sp. OV194]